MTRRLQLLGVDPNEAGDLVTVRSPMDGEVMEMAVAPGEYRSDTAAPVMTVADLSRVWVVASVPESGLGQVQTGQRGDHHAGGVSGSAVRRARRTRVAGALDPDTRTGKVIAELDNPQRLLRPEMFARVRYTGTRTAGRDGADWRDGAAMNDARRCSSSGHAVSSSVETCRSVRGTTTRSWSRAV